MRRRRGGGGKWNSGLWAWWELWVRTAGSLLAVRGARCARVPVPGRSCWTWTGSVGSGFGAGDGQLDPDVTTYVSDRVEVEQLVVAHVGRFSMSSLPSAFFERKRCELICIKKPKAIYSRDILLNHNIDQALIHVYKFTHVTCHYWQQVTYH